MKKFFLVLSIAAFFASCKKDDGFTIIGEAKGVENDKMVIIATQSDLGPVSKDTVKVKDGKFEFKGKIKQNIEHWLEGFKKSGIITNYITAERSFGGEGAYRIYIKSKLI